MMHRIICDRTEFIQINFVVFIENSFVCADIYDFAYKSAGFFIVTDELTFKCHRQFIKKRSIYELTLCNMPTCFFYFIRLFVTGNSTNIVASNNIFCVCNAYSKGTRFYNILCSLVPRINTNRNLCFFTNAAPRSITCL